MNCLTISGTNLVLKRFEIDTKGLRLPDVIALDPSLTGTGIAIVREGVVWAALMPPKTKSQRGIERLAYLGATWSRVLDAFPHLPLCIENYAFSRGDSHAHGLGEIGGLYKLRAFERGRRVHTPMPNQIKKMVTGSGNAAKELMLKELLKRFAIDVDDNNVADAVAIALFYGYGVAIKQGLAVQLPQKNTEALLEAIKGGVFDGEVASDQVRDRPRVRAA